MSEFRQYLLLFKAHRKMSRARMLQKLRESRLMVLTLAVFLVLYGFLGFILFSRGLTVVTRLPGVGGFLGDRVLYLIFFFFFIMLIFSVGITSFIGMIKGKEIPWLLSLPVSHRAIFMWKATESVLVASWGLLFISAPLLLAFASARDAEPLFYLQALVILIPFVMVAATVGVALFLIVLRWISRPSGIAVVVIVLGALSWYGYTVYDDAVDASQKSLGVVALDQILKHTEASVHPISPSTWLTTSLIQWTRQVRFNASFHSLALWSNALFGVVVLAVLGKTWFYSAWVRDHERAANAASRRSERSRGKALKWPQVAGRRMRPIRAVIRKDIITFFREPSQWVQFVIVFSLLIIYILNLRNMGYDYESPFWAAVISYLNLTVCSLALSTLTTRFVFPQFSLEGNRLWILGMAPIGLEKVVIQKWLQAVLFTGILTTSLQVLSGYMLKLPIEDIALFGSAVFLMSMGLCGISVGLGAIFPNLQETNSARIVSGFGGTLCLIVSFLYIIGLVGVLTLAKVEVFRTRGDAVALGDSPGQVGLSIGGAILLTLLAGGIPIFLAMKRVKRLELSGSL